MGVLRIWLAGYGKDLLKGAVGEEEVESRRQGRALPTRVSPNRTTRPLFCCSTGINHFSRNESNPFEEGKRSKALLIQWGRRSKGSRQTEDVCNEGRTRDGIGGTR